MTDPTAVSALSKALAIEFGKAGFFKPTASLDFLTQQAEMMLRSAILAHPFTDAQRAAIAAAVLTPEVLAEAVDQHVHGIGWDRMCTGENCGAAILDALRDAGKEPEHE